MSAKNKLIRLEKLYSGSNFLDVHSWIRAGRYYDELTQNERARYCQYHYGPEYSEPPEVRILQIMGEPFNYHFRLEYKPGPLASAERQAIIEELETYFNARRKKS